MRIDRKEIIDIYQAVNEAPNKNWDSLSDAETRVLFCALKSFKNKKMTVYVANCNIDGLIEKIKNNDKNQSNKNFAQKILHIIKCILCIRKSDSSLTKIVYESQSIIERLNEEFKLVLGYVKDNETQNSAKKTLQANLLFFENEVSPIIQKEQMNNDYILNFEVGDKIVQQKLERINNEHLLIKKREILDQIIYNYKRLIQHVDICVERFNQSDHINKYNQRVAYYTPLTQTIVIKNLDFEQDENFRD